MAAKQQPQCTACTAKQQASCWPLWYSAELLLVCALFGCRDSHSRVAAAGMLNCRTSRSHLCCMPGKSASRLLIGMAFRWELLAAELGWVILDNTKKIFGQTPFPKTLRPAGRSLEDCGAAQVGWTARHARAIERCAGGRVCAAAWPRETGRTSRGVVRRLRAPWGTKGSVAAAAWWGPRACRVRICRPRVCTVQSTRPRESTLAVGDTCEGFLQISFFLLCRGVRLTS